MDLIQKKMEIAKRAGELEKEINGFVEVAKRIEWKIANREGLSIQIHDYSNSSTKLYSNSIEGEHGIELHGVVLGYLDSIIEKRKVELDELIKVMV